MNFASRAIRGEIFPAGYPKSQRVSAILGAAGRDRDVTGGPEQPQLRSAAGSDVYVWIAKDVAVTCRSSRDARDGPRTSQFKFK